MNSILGTKDCYGCGVCAASCKKDAIRMTLNSFGFYEPEVDENLCVNCGVCVDVCSFRAKDVEQDNGFEPRCFASWSYNGDIRKSCSSGGVGFEIGRYLLKKDYAAIVCRYNSSNGRAEHYLALTEEELRASIGSKYIQSNAYLGFSQLRNDKMCFVVGTPCQIDSIRRWIKKQKMEDRVVLMDFFCHGVPSMLMWNKYLSEVGKKVGIIDNIVWRDKETGWHDSWVMKVGERYVSRFSQGDLFYRMFLKNRCLAKPCYEACKFKGLRSAADIRIGDLWGSKYIENEEGVNGVVGLTRKGIALLEEMDSVLYLESLTADIICESQMKECAHRPQSYNYVMKSLHTGKSLGEIDKVARIIEMIEDVPCSMKYYASRLPVKLGEMLKSIVQKGKS